MKNLILEKFHQLNCRKDDTFGCMLIQLPKHLSCRLKENLCTVLDEILILQSDVKERLKTLDKNSRIVKIFEDNKCPVCLSNYKEIFEEDLHILIPSCGHPLCCNCADNILLSKKKECPQCRGKVDACSFNLMNFNDSLEINTQDQKVFF